MKPIKIMMMTAVTTALLTGTALAVTVFESGTTCTSATDIGGHDKCLGPFTPTVNTIVTLPPDGILDYSSVNIPSTVTVKFTKNANNTPVTIRSFGNVTIEGVITVSAGENGSSATATGTAGNGYLGDDGQPGTGGPGGFDGGYGGYSPLFGGEVGKPGGSGKGPGGGPSQLFFTGTPCNGNWNGMATSGVGGGFGTAGYSYDQYCFNGSWQRIQVAAYGQPSLLPLIGGSGGSGGYAGSSYNGAGGGGGGGAILIAAGTASAPATITVGKSGTYGYIFADGGAGGITGGSNVGAGGGGGSGGAIRLVADKLANPNYGYLYARGGAAGTNAAAGGAGRIRLEGNTVTGWHQGLADPDYTDAFPGHVTVPNNPTLTIVSVTPTAGPENGVTKTAPANPNGYNDITFQKDTTTATISLSGYYIPTGITATVHVIPASGAGRTSTTSTAFSGSNTGTSTATATVTLSPGNNVILAAVTYTVTEVIAMNLPQFNGEYVAKIRVEGGMDGKSQVTYITASGKEYPAVKAKG